ncbi:cytochrome c oxidase assembly factor Coa1 family protein [Xanthomonas campestris]|uniref:cytochrome c oxidase assembly factor Coa1 family protein n=1 Tax=Xanthomonas campestris TaxID=339 RepID=UPI0023EE3504|nr:cytochrome c oxidase assembly factor Coa1 family protein [Xanthomonas campestris]
MSTPPPLPHPATPPPPARRGWWSRHWKWAVPLLALLLIVVLAASIGALVAGIARVMKSTEPYRVGVLTAQHDPRVATALGAPIKDGFLPSGNIATSGGGGHATLSVSLHGARGNGTLYIEAERHAGQWHNTSVQVVPDVGDTIALLDDATAAASGARATDAGTDPDSETTDTVAPGKEQDR